MDLHWANIWNYRPDEYLIDGEWIRSNIRLTYAQTDALSYGIAVPIVGRTGGFADPLIEDFHKAFRLGNANRQDFPQNRSLVSIRTDGVDHTIVEGESWGIGDVSGFVSSRLTEGTRVLPAITVQAQVSLPSGDKDELRGTGAASAALGAVVSKRLGDSPFLMFGGVGSEYCPADEIAGVEVHKDDWSGLGGITYEYSPTLSVIAQYLVSSAVAKEAFAFSKPCHEVSVGLKWRVTAQGILEFAVVENVAIFENSADIGVHLCFGTVL